jgi:hypothetical protein
LQRLAFSSLEGCWAADERSLEGGLRVPPIARSIDNLYTPAP